MKQTGPYISTHGVDKSGFKNLAATHWNYRPAALYEEAIRRNEGQVAANGPLVVKTGSHTGRSAKDKFIVRDDTTEKTVWWDNNKSMTPEAFDLLHQDMLKHAEGKELFIQDLFGGADPTHRLPTRVYTEYAWHSLFIQNLLIEPKAEELEDFLPQFTIIDLPSFEADPARYGIRTGTVIACNFAKRIVLIGGTSYAGEIKTISRAYPDALVAPNLTVAGTDSRHYLDLTDNVFRFIPIRVTPDELAGFHGTNERITVTTLGEAIGFYWTLMQNLDEPALDGPAGEGGKG